MRQGLAPQQAAEAAVRRIARRRPSYVGAVVAVSNDGRHGGAAHGWRFQYSFASPATGGEVVVVDVPPLALEPPVVQARQDVQSAGQAPSVSSA